MAPRRIAVVLFNLGGPDSQAAVRPFLFNLFADPAIIRLPGPARLALATLISTTRARSARANYQIMGGASPLLPETRAQAEALRAALTRRLAPAVVECFIAMRYWKPFSDETAKKVAAFAPDEIVLLPLYPQFSTTTTASSMKAWEKAYRGPGDTRAVCCYPVQPDFIDAHVEKIRAAFVAAPAGIEWRLLFSAHGLPQQVVDAGDPYQRQIEATAAAIAARLGGELDWKVCYQSRVGRLKWLGPSTPQAIEEAAGEGLGVVVCPIAFVSDHVETLVELDHEYAKLAHDVGCPGYVRVAALGVTPAFIEGLARSVQAALATTGPAPAEGWTCEACGPICLARQSEGVGG
jgi:ferrochelatase